MGRTTNKQRREQQAQSAREKAAAARLQQRRADQRRRARNILSGALAIIVVVVVIVVVAVTRPSKNDKSGNRTVASPAVVSAVTNVAPATFSSIGQGSAQLSGRKINTAPLMQSGKPELLFIGAEWCPICAAERWSIATALSRFGTFSGLQQVRSAVNDGDIASLSFYKSTYTSKYLSFEPVENADRDHNTLEALTSAQKSIFEHATGSSQLAYPFLDFGGKYVQTTEGYDGSVLGSMDQEQIARQLAQPNSDVAKAIVGEANNLTGMICAMTGNKPAKVCSGPLVSAIQNKLNA